VKEYFCAKKKKKFFFARKPPRFAWGCLKTEKELENRVILLPWFSSTLNKFNVTVLVNCDPVFFLTHTLFSHLSPA
jgi:hypothetical protein